MTTSSFNTVCFVGLGYIGLPTAAVLASTGTHVIGLDVNSRVVDTINRGDIHIVEPGLAELVNRVVKSGHLRATTVAEPADAFVIAVPTPFKGEHEPDVSYIESAGRAIASVLKKGDLVVLESTSPVGTTEALARLLSAARPDLSFPLEDRPQSDIRVAYCPERVLPGQVIKELVSNDRVIGGLTKDCSARAVGLYKLFVQGECVVSDARTAEMCKLTENSFRDVNIAFANELSIICDRLGINVWELISIANRHPRVNILRPGPGVGGHCIAVDPWFIVNAAPDLTNIISAARNVNDQKPIWVLNRIDALVLEIIKAGKAKTIRDISIACFGLTFKPNIDDFRESPALAVVKKMQNIGFKRVYIVEPNLRHFTDLKTLGIDSAVTPIEAIDAIRNCEIIIFLVGHSQFKLIDRKMLSNRLVLDTCGALES